MISADSIYSQIVADIEKDLPLSIKRPTRRTYANTGESINSPENTKESGSFQKALESATSSAITVIDNTVAATGTKDERIEAAIKQASQKYGVEYALIKGIIKAESSFNPDCVSSAGAMGLMQLMPCNVEEYNVSDPFNIEENIDAGTRHIKDMLDRYNGDITLALAGYNAGPGNVAKYGGVPPFNETQNYIPRVLSYAESYR